MHFLGLIFRGLTSAVVYQNWQLLGVTLCFIYTVFAVVIVFTVVTVFILIVVSWVVAVFANIVVFTAAVVFKVIVVFTGVVVFTIIVVFTKRYCVRSGFCVWQYCFCVLFTVVFVFIAVFTVVVLFTLVEWVHAGWNAWGAYGCLHQHTAHNLRQKGNCSNNNWIHSFLRKNHYQKGIQKKTAKKWTTIIKTCTN